MEADADDELVAAISSDVMTCLVRAGFLDKLDNLLCPADNSSKSERCTGDFRFSERILLASGFNPTDLFDIFAVLRSKGGCCDCEVLYNAAETSRLKSQYWKKYAKGFEDPFKHPDQ